MDSLTIEGVVAAKEDAGKRRMTMPPPERKRLSDITNVSSGNRQSLQLRAEDRNSAKAVLLVSGKDYIAQLVKENSALLKLLEEKNKAMEMSNFEIQKLRVIVQKTQQENWLLAQTNSHMLADLNLGKDRLKALQHELGCTSALLKAKTLELKEAKKLNKELKQLPKKDVAEPAYLASQKRPCNPNKKRMLRTQSLGPSIPTYAAPEEKDDDRRSLRRKSSNLKRELSEPTEDLFEIEDIKCPITTPKPEQKASARPKVEKVELRRSSLGRPLRKAVENVSCYKEIPVNCKMRRE